MDRFNYRTTKYKRTLNLLPSINTKKDTLESYEMVQLKDIRPVTAYSAVKSRYDINQQSTYQYTSRRHDGRNIIGSDHNPKLTVVSNRTRSSTPNGLPNLGNTCYFNATLQCLFWCKGFHTLMNYKPAGEVSERLIAVFRYLDGKDNLENARPSSFLCRFGTNKANTGNKLVKHFLDIVRKRNDQFEGYSQQDSFEMLNTILSSLQEEYKEKSTRTSLIDEEFGGTFLTTYVHDQCQKVDLVFQNFTTITIPVMQSKTNLTHTIGQSSDYGSHFEYGNAHGQRALHTDQLCLSISRCGDNGVIKGLREVAKEETMDANILPCRKCHVSAFGKLLKRSTIISLPKILILHISRFSQSGWSLHKDQRLITYPYILNISDVCSSAVQIYDIGATSMDYELCGVVCHSGTMNYGHYTAYVNTAPYEGKPTVKYNPKDKSKDIEEFLSKKIGKPFSAQRYSDDTFSGNNSSHKWYRISDSLVQRANSPLDLNDAYILFYRLQL